MLIDHIGIVVKRLEKGIIHWQNTFGYHQATEIITNTIQQVRVVFLEKAKSVPIKLVEPANPQSPISTLANKETPIELLFGDCPAKELEVAIIQAPGTKQRIGIINQFLLQKLGERSIVDNIVKTTIDALLATNGNAPVSVILKEDQSKRRQLERKFLKQIGISPKQLGKVIRLQSALKMLLNEDEKKIAAWRLCLRDSRNVYHCSAEILKSFTLEQWLVLVNKDARTYVKLPNGYKTHVYVGPYFAMLLKKKGNGYYNDMIPWDALGIQAPH